jgi:hypothetical protein
MLQPYAVLALQERAISIARELTYGGKGFQHDCKQALISIFGNHPVV